MRRIALALLLLLVPACGLAGNPGSAGDPGSAGPGPSETAPAAGVAVTPDPTPAPPTTTPAPPTTIPAPATSVTTPAADLEVAPYFLVDEDGHDKRSGPFLAPVARIVPHGKAVARAAIEQLLTGPTNQERTAVPAISSAIPKGVRLLGLTIDEGTATVDLSSGFALGEDSAAVAQRVAQVVFTLTRFDSVQRVRFLEQGQESAVPTAAGDLVTSVVTRGDYLDFAPAIAVETPVHGGRAMGPLRVTGFAAVFEATFRYSLTDAQGLLLDEGFASTSNGTGWGSFDFTIDYDVAEPQEGDLAVWVNSAQDGSRVDVRHYPVLLQP